MKMKKPSGVKNYFIVHPDLDEPMTVFRLTEDEVILWYHEDAHVRVINTGNGYRVEDTNIKGTQVYEFDYSLPGDVMALLTILHQGDAFSTFPYWSIYEGRKLG